MPLCHRTKQAFIHIPKCGGTTVEHRYNLLSKEKYFAEDPTAYVYDNIAYAPQHLTPYHLNKLVPNFSDYNTFTFVRCPLEKAVSEFFFIRRHLKGQPKQHIFSNINFQYWIDKNARSPQLDHLIPQWNYAKDTKHIFPLQHFNQTLPTLDQWFGRKPIPLEKRLVSDKHWYRWRKRTNSFIASHLSRRSEKLIHEIYAEDYDNLNSYFNS